MACTKCKKQCNCTPSPCATTPIVPVCADPEYCEDVFSDKCIVHDGDDLTAIGAVDGTTRLSTILESINDSIENLLNAYNETNYSFFANELDTLTINTTDNKFYRTSDNSEYSLEFDVTGFKSFTLEATGKITTGDDSGYLYVRFYNAANTVLEEVTLGSTEGTVYIDARTYASGSSTKHHIIDRGSVPSNDIVIASAVTKVTITPVFTSGQLISSLISNFILTIRK
jgi:hypothetical protein